jgi:hypothetical protein
MNKKDIEKKEFEYLNQTEYFINENLEWILKRLKSKNEIKKDWIKIFKATARESYDKASELDVGAERVFHNLFGKFNMLMVNSTPIGADLMFETYDSIIHIDIKTTTESNPADFGGKIQVGQNQTSYSVYQTKKGNKYPFKASLPTFYSNGKICLTYIIQIIYNNDDDQPKIISLFSIPNGRLYNTYGNCVNAGKHRKDLNKLGSRGDIRFLYKDASKFENLKDKPSRIKVIFPKSPSQNILKKYLGINKL